MEYFSLGFLVPTSSQDFQQENQQQGNYTNKAWGRKGKPVSCEETNSTTEQENNPLLETAFSCTLPCQLVLQQTQTTTLCLASPQLSHHSSCKAPASLLCSSCWLIGIVVPGPLSFLCWGLTQPAGKPDKSCVCLEAAALPWQSRDGCFPSAKGGQPGYLASIAFSESSSVYLTLRALLIVPKASKYMKYWITVGYNQKVDIFSFILNVTNSNCNKS